MGKSNNELNLAIQLLYGNAPLSKATLKNLGQIWKTNPEIIINAVHQKLESLATADDAARIQNIEQSQRDSAPTFYDESLNDRIVVYPEYAKQESKTKKQDAQQKNFDSMPFSKAFRAAREQGLKMFTWKGNIYGTELKKSEPSQNDAFIYVEKVLPETIAIGTQHNMWRQNISNLYDENGNYIGPAGYIGDPQNKNATPQKSNIQHRW